MKILHVIANLSPRYGGPVKVCRELTSELTRQGVETTLYSTNLDFPKGILSVPTDLIISDGGVRIRYFSVSFPPLAISNQMASAIIQNMQSFDLIHIHGIYRFPQTFAAWYARKIGKPYIIRPHGSLDPFLYKQKKNRLLKRLYEHLIELRNLRKAQAIHFTSEEERELTKFLCLNDNGVVIPNGIDISKYSSLPEPNKFRDLYKIGKNVPVVLFLGRLHFKKGLDLLIPAFANVLDNFPTAILVLAGPDNNGYIGHLRKLINENNIAEHVIFTGMLSEKETIDAYVDANVFVLSSYTENFGMTVVEAMACRLPVVISDKVNIWQEVQNARAGIVVPCDVKALSNGIIEILLNGDQAAIMGNSGFKLVQQRYAWKVIIPEIIQLYQRIINQNKDTSRTNSYTISKHT